ncbi:hypothetical protein EV121DRAFT_274919, partial [Schizophyllum commune]
PVATESSSSSAPLPASYFTLKRKDILRLAPDTWLNDEIINFFVELFTHNPQSRHNGVVALMSNFANHADIFPTDPKGSNPQFATSAAPLAARFGGLKLIDASNVKDLKLLLIPLHVHGNHWCLFVMDFVNRHGAVYDSLPPNVEENTALFKRMRKCMQAVWKLKEIPVDNDWWEEWQWFCDPPAVPRQSNIIDCGVYCISFMVHLHKWGKINHEDIPVPSRIPLRVRRAHLLRKRGKDKVVETEAPRRSSRPTTQQKTAQT